MWGKCAGAEAPVQPRRILRCSICQVVGHNRTTCPGKVPDAAQPEGRAEPEAEAEAEPQAEAVPQAESEGEWEDVEESEGEESGGEESEEGKDAPTPSPPAKRHQATRSGRVPRAPRESL